MDDQTTQFARVNKPVSGGKLRVALISSGDPLDVHSFSGSIYYMARALKSVFPDLEIVRSSRAFWFPWLQRICLRVSKGKIDPYYWRPLNRWFASRLRNHWKNQRVVVVGVVNAALVSELAASVPIINVSDSTYDLMRTEHVVFWSLGERAAMRAEDDELRSIRRSVHNSFSSRWAANSAVDHYGASPLDVSVISWGCNFDTVPKSEARSDPFKPGECRLLFIGGEWERKGGDVALAVAETLIGRGYRVRLDVVGDTPPTDNGDRPWLRAYGYLSKAKPADAELLRSLMSEADLLFLPTKRDCTPMVFAEANAYGTPALTRDVGGVADVVHDGRNGIVLPGDADPALFASTIEKLWADPVRYVALRRSARLEYDNRLNWQAWGSGIAAQIERLVAEGRI